jgi:hypothetical protein
MRRLLILVGAIATLAAGVTAAVALGAGTSSPDTSTGTTTAATAGTTTTTAPDTTTTAVAAGTTTLSAPDTTTAPDTSTGTTTAAPGGATATTTSSTVWVCHHTGSWKHPYHLIQISTRALPAHMRHGDVTPGADNSCPTTQPAGTKTHGRGNGQSDKAKTKDDHPGKGDDETQKHRSRESNWAAKAGGTG